MSPYGFMAAEHVDLPEPVKREVQAFTAINVAWLSKVLSAANVVRPEGSKWRPGAIFAAVGGAQLMATSRSGIALYHTLIGSYRTPDFYRRKWFDLRSRSADRNLKDKYQETRFRSGIHVDV